MTKTLVVEDNRDIADFLAIILEREGHVVTVASDGVEALRLVRTRDFNLVVMDQNLPGLTGLEVIDTAAGIPGGPRFIIMTGQPWVHLKRDSRVDRFVAKPFDAKQFLGIVRDLVRGPALTLTP